MGIFMSCASTQDIDRTLGRTPPVTTIPQQRQRGDIAFTRPLVIAHHLHDRLLQEIATSGSITSRLSGHLNPVGFHELIDWTLAMSDPFAEIAQHLHDKNLHPIVAVERFPRSPTGLRVIALASHEDVDWLPTLFTSDTMFHRLCSMCDLSLHNDGHTLVVHPHLLHTTPDGSVSSMTTQYGSLLSLANDCNWDTSRAVARSTIRPL